jgi:hypothetical protein
MNTPATRTPLEVAHHARYRIRNNPLADRARPFEIIDDLMGGHACALPDASGFLKTLTFRNEKSARAWLVECQQRGTANA